MKKQHLQRVHFLDKLLFNPTNQISINIIGAGGTGSHLAKALARIDYALVAMGHSGLRARIFDNDFIETPNFGRSDFIEHFDGFNKAVSVVSYINRKYGVNWEAVPYNFEDALTKFGKQKCSASFTFSCVDCVDARFKIADALETIGYNNLYGRDRPLYWMDFGNTQYTGQMIFSTLTEVEQPKSELFQPIGTLPKVTDEFKDQLNESRSEDSKPSCSLLESLNEQSLFINSALAGEAGSFIMELLTTGMTQYRGFAKNIKQFRTEPIYI